MEGLADAFLVMPELSHLTIIQTDLPELPETITRCSKLGQLLISYSGLARLPENMGLCRGLHSITIVRNKLRRAARIAFGMPEFAFVAGGIQSVERVPRLGRSVALDQRNWF
jgi:Leucine-rich repeat (LRR) protein